MPCRISEKNGLEMSGTVTSSLRVRSVRRFFAAAFGVKPRRVIGGHDLAPRRRRDDVGLAEHARDGRGRDAGAFGDFVDVGHACRSYGEAGGTVPLADGARLC